MILFNGQEIKFTRFPNSETKVDEQSIINTETNRNRRDYIEFKYENDSDLIKLMLVKRYLDEKVTDFKCHLRIYYMPYSRMDRSENDSVFTLKYISGFINSLNFDYVEVIEPHSDVTTALLNNCEAKFINYDLLPEVMDEVWFSINDDYIFFPDAGAQKRYSKLVGCNQLVGYKKRDWETGKITELKVVGDVKYTNKVIIVDDLCSYGGTFISAAKELKKLGFEEIYLLVAHCENSIFAGKIFSDIPGEGDLIDRVFTTDTIISDYEHCEVYKNETLKVFKIQEVI